MCHQLSESHAMNGDEGVGEIDDREKNDRVRGSISSAAQRCLRAGGFTSWRCWLSGGWKWSRARPPWSRSTRTTPCCCPVTSTIPVRINFARAVFGRSGANRGQQGFCQGRSTSCIAAVVVIQSGSLCAAMPE